MTTSNATRARLRRTGIVLSAGATTLAAALFSAPAPVSAQDLGALAPLIGELVAPRERLDDGEIRQRSLEAGAGAFLADGGRATPERAFRSYQAYRDEERRLQEAERQRKRAQVEAVIGAFGALMRR